MQKTCYALCDLGGERVTELLKVGLVFIGIIALTFMKVDLWITLLVASFSLGLLFHLSVVKIGMSLFVSALDEKTLLLVGALTAILLFSNLLKETGRMNKILEGFRNILKDARVLITLLPAIIGLIPIMGGALISAPMVVEDSDRLKLSPERRTFINYWFRHVWEFILPIFPAFVLAATLGGISFRRFSWFNLPLTAAAILGGFFTGFWGVSKSVRAGGASASQIAVFGLFKNLFSLIFALLLVVVFEVELAYAFGLTILGMILLYRINGRVILNVFRESVSIELLLTVVLVMGFKKVLESCQVIPAICTTLSLSGIPILVIVMFVPFLIGLITGFPLPTVGIVFPNSYPII